MLANVRPHPVNVRLANVCPRLVNVRLVNVHQVPVNVRTRASLNPTSALDNLIATPSLLVEVGN
jgi:hypothetical protein